MCENAIFPCLQGIRMSRERNKTWMNDQLKRRYNSHRKNSLLFLKFSFKKFNLKINVKKQHNCSVS